MQDLIRRQPGVVSTRVGYTGGQNANATYRNHPGHAEAIEIVYDPAQTDFRNILEFFFQIHDPTTKDRQGNDVGTSYRSAIFYVDDEQKRVALDTIADVEASGSVAGQGRHRGHAGRRLLGGRAGAPGLPAALPERLHLPLPLVNQGEHITLLYDRAFLKRHLDDQAAHAALPRWLPRCLQEARVRIPLDHVLLYGMSNANIGRRRCRCDLTLFLASDRSDYDYAIRNANCGQRARGANLSFDALIMIVQSLSRFIVSTSLPHSDWAVGSE